jgi:UDP-2,3-diacylglucosamine pyrophosphatase LpxH
VSEGAVRRSQITLVVSDLHLGEGRRNWDGTLNVLEDFAVDHRFAEFLDFYSKAHEQIELVINGNFMEMLRCRAVRDYPDLVYETYAVEIVRVIADGHPGVFEALRKFMENPNHRLVYVMGETDVGILWPKVQDELKRIISDRIEFQYSHYFSQGVYIEHGHQYEAMYAMDLQKPFHEVNGLPVLNLPWGSFFNANFVQPLRRVRPQFYRVRPMRNYLVWSLLFETRFFLKVVGQFLRMVFLASSRKLYPGNSLWTVFRIFKQAADTEALEEYAEVLLDTEKIQKVVFGHAHIPNYRQFKNNKEYFNSGTWTRNLSLDLRSLGSFHKLTYVLLESRGHEVNGRLMEWKGKHDVIEDFA